ncbi:DUF5977 domain-containing protein [Pedobacter africanus]|uniref:DUF5977 domain-containing protein n=1 Tax=Pedobacter africanus TaxID=151894 RepID=A0A1W2BBL9_9SPHI|nr:DUF5977 domain-containing protein [Pedobacter africanus]SMC70365.1 hypothetical protein SAMN04488524_2209 [Pedobacter africanus]
MKKLFLLCSAIICCLQGYAQTFSPSSATINSGDQVTITTSGETATKYLTNIYLSEINSISITPGSSYAGYISSVMNGLPDFYSIATQRPTSFKATINNSYTAAIKIKIAFQVSYNGTGGSGSERVFCEITVNPTPVPTSYGNQVRSRTFYKNDCSSGFESDPYVYTVPANTFTAPTQAEANALADARIDAQGQNAANAALTCKQVYYNTEASAVFTKNNCGPNLTPTAVTYIVTANKHKSLISQADADAKAQADIDANGQNYANANGMCIAVPYIEGPDQAYTTVDYTYFVGNRSPGETYEWIIPTNFTVVSGLTDFSITLVPKRAGTAPNTKTIKVKITKSNGEILTISKQVTIIYCLNCPI